MRKRNTIFYILFIVILAGCGQPKKETTEAGQTIRLTPPTKPDVEKLITTYDTIRLEVSDNSLLSGIMQIFVMNKKLYVTEISQNAVFIFNLQGKFLSKIGNQGSGPNEYVKIGNFETDPANNRLLLTDTFSKRLFVYDEMGKLTEVLPLDFMPQRIASDKSGRFIHLNSSTEMLYQAPEMSKHSVHIIGQNGKAEQCFLEDDTPNRIDIMTVHAANLSEEGELLYMPMLSGTIYRIHGSEAIPAYVFDNQTGLATISAADKKEIFYQYSRNNLEETEANGKLISCGNFLHSDSLLFSAHGWNKKIFSFYSKTTGQSLTIAPDEMKGNEGLRLIFSQHPKALTGNQLYISVSPDLVNIALPLLPEGKMKSFFGSMTENDNPCIIRYRVNL